MESHKLAMYLTYEFTAHFIGVEALKKLLLFKEVKIWSCPDSGLPILSYGKYHGPRHVLSELPMIFSNAIHVRIKKEHVLKMELSRGRNDNEENTAQRAILKDIYEQILSQLEEFGNGFDNEEVVNMVGTKTKEINALCKVLGGKGNGQITAH